MDKIPSMQKGGEVPGAGHMPSGMMIEPVQCESINETIKRDIIKAHLWYLQRLSMLTDRERRYFLDEYFPTVKGYLKEPEFAHKINVNGVWQFDNDFNKKYKVNVDSVFPPSKVNERRGTFMIDIDKSPTILRTAERFKTVTRVTIARNEEAFISRKNICWALCQGTDYTVNSATGEVGFPGKLNRKDVLDAIEAREDYYYIFIEYEV